MQQRSVVIVAAKRTPMGRFMGAFADVPAVDLGIAAARAALDAAGLDPGEVQETVAGHGRQAGNGPNLARQVGRRAGLADTVPAFTINKACASGLQAIVSGASRMIRNQPSAPLETFPSSTTCIAPAS